MLKSDKTCSGITWLASYPKSGNTWMRVFLANYLSGDDQPVDINTMECGPIASDRVWFDEWVGIEASVLDDDTIESFRPGVYRCLQRQFCNTPVPFYMKVHDAWRLTRDGNALFPMDVTMGVIYIVRNPLDMAASCANHWAVSIENAVRILCDANYSISRSHGGLTNQLRQFLGSWSHHIESWVDHSGLPVCVIRYEDLKSDPYTYFKKVIQFCELSYDNDRLLKAIRFSDFKILQSQETENGFRERLVQSSGMFFRKGESGLWKDELSDELVQLIRNTHRDMMRRYGYWEGN